MIHTFGGVVYKNSAGINSKLPSPNSQKITENIFFDSGKLSDTNCMIDSIYASDSKWREELKQSVCSEANPEINGHWAIAYLDQNKNKLYLSRDRIGVKFIYYYENSDLFIFSNSIRWILNSNLYKGQISFKAAQAFLIQGSYSHENENLFEGIKELPASCTLSYDLHSHSHKTKSYYQLNFSASHEDYASENIKEFSRELKDLVLSSVIKSKDFSNLGSFLSGGMDSSVLGYHYAQTYDAPKNFLSIGFPNSPLDESHYASKLAAELPENKFSLITPQADDFISSIEQLHRIIELPTLSAGTFLQYCLFNEAKDLNLNVVLDGTGADALFGGHSYYNYFQALSIKAGGIEPTEEEKRSFQAIDKESKKRNILKYMVLPSLPKKLQHFVATRYYQDWKYISKNLKRGSTVFENVGLSNHRDVSLNQKLQQDYFAGPVKELLRFTDRMGRHFKVAGMHPFVENQQLMEFVFNIPGRYKIYNGELKHVMRSAYRNVLPNYITDRKDKMGLVAPNNKWIRDHKDRWVSYFENLPDGYLNVNKIKQDHTTLFDPPTDQENYRLFKLISFAIWYHVHKEYL